MSNQVLIADRGGAAMLGALRKRFAQPVWAVVAIVVCANCFVGGLVAISLGTSYRQYQERAATTSRNINRLVAQGIAGEIDRIDLGLQAVGDEFVRLHAAGRLDRRALAEFLRRQQARLPMTEGMRVAHADGMIAAGSDRQLPPGVSIADREYFHVLRADPTAGLVISKPVLGRISGKWVLIFARRLTGSGGEFLGVVIAPVAIEWFEKMFARLEVGPRGAVVLRGNATRDFDLLGRFPPAGFVGQTKVSDQFKATIGADPQGGTYEAYAGADNVRRTFSYRAVGDHPLITLVGISTEDNLADWRRETALFGGMAALFAVLSAWGGWALVRAWNASAAAYGRIRGLNEELECDIAARRKAEGELAALNADLERRVGERTAELEVANKDLESFSYSVSHDLRTPLRSIVGYSQILLEDERERLSAQGQELLDRVVRNTDHMGKLIDDILDYSRVGRKPLERGPLDMSALARDIVGQLAGDYPAARIDVRDLPPGMGDRAMLEQVLRNLVGNALKYSAKTPQPEIVVGAEIDGDRTVYFVKDNGVGFDMQYAGGLFGMFQRMHKVSEFEGTGVGLAIVKRLIERNGGEVWADAEPGKGAVFRFTLGSETRTAAPS